MINWLKNALGRILTWSKSMVSTGSRSSILEVPVKSEMLTFCLEIKKGPNISTKDISITFETVDIDGIWERPGVWDDFWTDTHDRYTILFYPMVRGSDPLFIIKVKTPCCEETIIKHLNDLYEGSSEVEYKFKQKKGSD